MGLLCNSNAFSSGLPSTDKINKSDEDIFHESTRSGSTVQGSEAEDAILKLASDDKITYRWLKRDDYQLGFPSVLSNLTQGCEYEEKQFLARFDEMFPSDSQKYKIVVLVDNSTGMIVGSGTLFLEKKFLRNTGIVSNLSLFIFVCRLAILKTSLSLRTTVDRDSETV